MVKLLAHDKYSHCYLHYYKEMHSRLHAWKLFGDIFECIVCNPGAVIIVCLHFADKIIKWHAPAYWFRSCKAELPLGLKNITSFIFLLVLLVKVGHCKTYKVKGHNSRFLQVSHQFTVTLEMPS